jgi:hypothetical protein
MFLTLTERPRHRPVIWVDIPALPAACNLPFGTTQLLPTGMVSLACPSGNLTSLFDIFDGYIKGPLCHNLSYRRAQNV